MDRLTSLPALCRSGGRLGRDQLPHPIVPPVSADACPDPLDDNANRDDSRCAGPHSVLRKNRRSRALASSPCTSAGRKCRSCERRHKKCLRNPNRGSPARDTWFPMVEEVLVLSYAFDSKCVATASHTPH